MSAKLGKKITVEEFQQMLKQAKTGSVLVLPTSMRGQLCRHHEKPTTIHGGRVIQLPGQKVYDGLWDDCSTFGDVTVIRYRRSFSLPNEKAFYEGSWDPSWRAHALGDGAHIEPGVSFQLAGTNNLFFNGEVAITGLNGEDWYPNSLGWVIDQQTRLLMAIRKPGQPLQAPIKLQAVT